MWLVWEGKEHEGRYLNNDQMVEKMGERRSKTYEYMGDTA